MENDFENDESYRKVLRWELGTFHQNIRKQNEMQSLMNRPPTNEESSLLHSFYLLSSKNVDDSSIKHTRIRDTMREK